MLWLCWIGCLAACMVWVLELVGRLLCGFVVFLDCWVYEAGRFLGCTLLLLFAMFLVFVDIGIVVL